MPDDGPFLFPRRDPERIDLAAIKTDIECVMWQIAKLRRDSKAEVGNQLPLFGPRPRAGESSRR